MSMMEPAATATVVAVFASDKGPGDPERASIMSQAGSYFARRGMHIVCLAENGIIPVPLITAARTAGGMVQIVADATSALPRALAGVTMEVVPDKAERLARVAQLAQAYVALPGSLASASALSAMRPMPWCPSRRRVRPWATRMPPCSRLC